MREFYGVLILIRLELSYYSNCYIQYHKQFPNFSDHLIFEMT